MISNKKRMFSQKKSKENSLRETGRDTIFTGTPLDDVQCTATQSPAPSTLSVGIKPTIGGNNQSEYTLNDHTPHSLSISGGTQARSQDLGQHPTDRLISDSSCRSLPQTRRATLATTIFILSEGRTMHDILLAPEPHAGRLPIGWTTQ